MYELKDNYFNAKNDKTWKVAIYVRLSREDEKDENYKGQSESIENQINFLKRVVKCNHWTLIDVYKDDGYTGTNFQRPDFQRMIEDIENRKINLVVTKDLSRLGRDYIETGNYIEKYFPSKGIRYIAVNDNIDTYDRKNANNDMTPFKSVINDMYARDTSNKVRTVLLIKAMEGKCIKPFLPYGYKKDEKDKQKILIDENVADNVKTIFELYKSGRGKKQIADYLNELEIATPLQYKNETTNYYNPNKNLTYKWNSTVINKILRDRTYVGDLVQLKYKKVNYKIKKIVKVPVEEQIIIPNHHKAIIERATFEAVKEMLDKQTNEWNYSGRKKHLLTGLVFCSCGSKITYNFNHSKCSKCICSGYKRYGKTYCKGIHLHEDELIGKVAKSLKNNVDKYLNINDLNYSQLTRNKCEEYRESMLALEKRKNDISRIISNLYEDKSSNIISTDTFMLLLKNYEKQKEEVNQQLKLLEGKSILNRENIKDEEMKEMMKNILDFNEITEENKSLVLKLIDKIIIEDKDIKIQYKFNVLV